MRPPSQLAPARFCGCPLFDRDPPAARRRRRPGRRRRPLDPSDTGSGADGLGAGYALVAALALLVFGRSFARDCAARIAGGADRGARPSGGGPRGAPGPAPGPRPACARTGRCAAPPRPRTRRRARRPRVDRGRPPWHPRPCDRSSRPIPWPTSAASSCGPPPTGSRTAWFGRRCSSPPAVSPRPLPPPFAGRALAARPVRRRLRLAELRRSGVTEHPLEEALLLACGFFFFASASRCCASSSFLASGVL